jgi:hypothetical protein
LMRFCCFPAVSCVSRRPKATGEPPASGLWRFLAGKSARAARALHLAATLHTSPSFLKR